MFGWLFWAYGGYAFLGFLQAAKDAQNAKPTEWGAALGAGLGAVYLWNLTIGMLVLGGLSHFCGIVVRLLLEIEDSTSPF